MPDAQFVSRLKLDTTRNVTPPELAFSYEPTRLTNLTSNVDKHNVLCDINFNVDDGEQIGTLELGASVEDVYGQICIAALQPRSVTSTRWNGVSVLFFTVVSVPCFNIKVDDG